MKAIVMKGVGKLSVEDVEIKKPADNEVLIKVHIAGLCGTDAHMLGGTNFEGTFPFVPGHEGMGHIIEVGSNVKTFKVGDRVTWDCVVPCMVCEVCKRGGQPAFCLNHRASGFMPEYPGSMAEYHTAPEERVFKLPDSVSDEGGVLVEVVSVPYHAIWADSAGGGVGPHDRVGIIGCGPIGLFALQIAQVSGAKVIAIEPVESRIKMAKEVGAKYIINPSKQNAVEEVMKLTNNLGFSKIIECSGSISGIAATVDMISVKGTIVLTGQSIGTKIPIEIGKIIWKNAKIFASNGAQYFFPNVIEFLSKNLIDAEKIITHRFPIEKAHEAFELGLKAESGKILIYPDAAMMPK